MYVMQSSKSACVLCNVNDIEEWLLGTWVHPSAGFDESDFPEIYNCELEARDNQSLSNASESDVGVERSVAAGQKRPLETGTTRPCQKFRDPFALL